MVELAVMRGGHGLEAITDVLTIELHDQAHKGEIVRWNALLPFTDVSVTEGWVVRGLHESVDTINTDKSLELVRVVALIQKLSERVGSENLVICTSLGDLDELLRVGELVT